MTQKLPLSVILMTYNEHINLPLCLHSVEKFINEIIIVDSFSTDKTLEIASKFTEKIYKNKFINYAEQFNWAITNTDINNNWILRLDADERWTKEGFDELRDIIAKDKGDGVYVKMKIYFMDKWIRHGGFYPNYFLRVFKKSKFDIENRWMDEHIRVNGKTIISNIDVIESNYDRQKNISLWIKKHNNYSTREAIDFFISKYKISRNNSIAKFSGNKTERKRWMKDNIYFKLPVFLRPFLYFIYRYFFQLGFMDGKEGFIFHTLQAFWYRFLVDTKIYQIEKIAKAENVDIKTVIHKEYGIEL
jgi:glycosyltransferase involved in cell wall biosynthesis